VLKPIKASVKREDRYMQRLHLVPSLLPLFLALCFATTQTGAQTPQQIAQKLFPKTLVLVLEGSDGQPSSLGSGFVIGPGVVATNRHVIEGAVRGFGKYVGTTQRLEIEGILAESAEHDLALIKIPAASISPVDLGNSDAIEIGETVYAIGSPVGLEGTFSNGIVSGFRNVGGQRLIQITAPISPGSSGGPVANSKGDVIGVAVATLKDGQNLNFAVPSSYLAQLSTKATTIRPLAIAKRDAGKARSIGAPITEGVIAHSFSWSTGIGLYGYFTLSLVNKLRDPVGKVTCLVVFYNKEGLPLASAKMSAPQPITIEPGAAVRVTGEVDPSVVPLVATYDARILGFQVLH
jgi:S1-C subfamily serine protease